MILEFDERHEVFGGGQAQNIANLRADGPASFWFIYPYLKKKKMKNAGVEKKKNNKRAINFLQKKSRVLKVHGYMR